MNADIGMDSFWENVIEIFVTNFYASRASLSIPYDLTDINNIPWGLKATYNGSVDRQQARIKLERQQSQQAPRFLYGSDSESGVGASSNSEDITPRSEFPRPKVEKKEKKPTRASIDAQLDSMLDIDHRGKVYANLKPFDVEDEPLIDNAGVKRVLDRGAIVVLSREYRDAEQMKRQEEEVLKAHKRELEESAETEKKPTSVRSEILATWEKTFFTPPEKEKETGRASRYEEHEQPFPSPWSQSPAPSPAILKESGDSPFFQTVESSFSSNDESDYTSTDATFAIGMENYRSIIHIPLVHPHTSKFISSEGESSGSSGHPKIVPIAIISFLSTVTPYPPHLITSLSNFAPLIATSLSQAIRHSNVLYQLTHSPPFSPRALRSRAQEQPSRAEGRHRRATQVESPATPSSATSETSSPSWEIQGTLFSPAVVQAETPSPFRSTLNIDIDYFSYRSPAPRSTSKRSSSREKNLRGRLESYMDETRSASSKSSWSQETAPLEQNTSSSSDKQPSPIKVHRRTRKSPRMVHSHGATSQFSSNIRTTPKKGRSKRRESFLEASDPYQMHTPSSRLLKVVVDSIPVHVFTASPGSGTITWANGRTLAYRGVTAEAYIANPHNSIHPDDSIEFLTRWNRMLRLETDGMSQSVRIKRFDGQYRWFAARVVPLRDARGEVVHWFGTAMDIHDAREAEINSARQEEIRASELKYRSLAEASPQIVFAATPSLGISYANSQWMSYSGVTFDETSNLGFLTFVHPDDRARCALPVRSNDPQFSVEIRLQAADKSYRWHLVKCIRIEERGNGKDDVWLGTWYFQIEACVDL